MDKVIIEIPVPHLWVKAGKSLYRNAKAGADFGKNAAWKFSPVVGIPSAFFLGAGIGLAAELVQFHINPAIFANVPTGLHGGYAASGGLLGIFANFWVDAADTEKNKRVYGFASYCGMAAGFVLGPILAPIYRKFRAVAKEVGFIWRDVQTGRKQRNLERAGESIAPAEKPPYNPLDVVRAPLRKSYILPLPRKFRRFLSGKNSPLTSEELQPYTDLERELSDIIQKGDPSGTYLERVAGIAKNPRLRYQALLLLSLATIGKSQLDEKEKSRAPDIASRVLDKIPGKREQVETTHAALCVMYMYLQRLGALGIGRTAAEIEGEGGVTSPVESFLIRRFDHTLERMTQADRFNTLFTKMVSNAMVYGLVSGRPLPDGFSFRGYQETRYKWALITLLLQDGVDDRGLGHFLRNDLHHAAPHKHPAPHL